MCFVGVQWKDIAGQPVAFTTGITELTASLDCGKKCYMSCTRTEAVTTTETVTQDQADLVLHLHPNNERPHVNWTTDTVDNENMGKKKSKCCCIYKKKKTWNDGSSSSDDSDCETGNCRGHVEKRHEHHSDPAGGDGGAEPCHREAHSLSRILAQRRVLYFDWNINTHRRVPHA
ncbi:unnamed protein product [Cylicocyclus nassatus]|uniref:E3 ubiquitin-protein ligase PPP1R11 n=1 Tax=Cylicocyclus nassatus TaxID=53992 RepID=A0AA36GLL2_CYLNA|nr:unnamed protein product [Cylicocyclus nassatus]